MVQITSFTAVLRHPGSNPGSHAVMCPRSPWIPHSPWSNGPGLLFSKMSLNLDASDCFLIIQVAHSWQEGHISDIPKELISLEFIVDLRCVLALNIARQILWKKVPSFKSQIQFLLWVREILCILALNLHGFIRWHSVLDHPVLLTFC